MVKELHSREHRMEIREAPELKMDFYLLPRPEKWEAVVVLGLLETIHKQAKSGREAKEEIHMEETEEKALILARTMMDIRDKMYMAEAEGQVVQK